MNGDYVYELSDVFGRVRIASLNNVTQQPHGAKVGLSCVNLSNLKLIEGKAFQD